MWGVGWEGTGALGSGKYATCHGGVLSPGGGGASLPHCLEAGKGAGAASRLAAGHSSTFRATQWDQSQGRETDRWGVERRGCSAAPPDAAQVRPSAGETDLGGVCLSAPTWVPPLHTQKGMQPSPQPRHPPARSDAGSLRRAQQAPTGSPHQVCQQVLAQHTTRQRQVTNGQTQAGVRGSA